MTSSPDHDSSEAAPSEMPAGGTSPPTAPPATPPTTVPADVTCIRCGYVLSGLDAAGMCPECGIEIARSLSDDRLVDADPVWLQRIMIGFALLAAGPVTSLIAATLAFIAFTVPSIAAISLSPAGERLVESAAYSLLAVAVAGLFGAAAGGIFLTVGEPRDEGREQLDNPRLVARWGLVTALGIALAAMLADSSGLPIPLVAARVAYAAFFAAAGFGLAALHERFRQIAVRIPAPTLATRCDTARTWYRRWTRFAIALVLARAVHDGLTMFGGLGQVADILDIVLDLAACVASVVLLMAIFKTIALLDLSLAMRGRIRLALREAAA